MLPDMAKNPTMFRQISILMTPKAKKPILDRLPPCQTPTLYTKPHDYHNLFFCHRLCRIATKRWMAVSNKALAPPIFLAYRTRLDQRRQSLGFGPDEGDKLVGRAAANFQAQLIQPLSDISHAQRFVHFAVAFLDDGLRCPGRRRQHPRLTPTPASMPATRTLILMLSSPMR